MLLKTVHFLEIILLFRTNQWLYKNIGQTLDTSATARCHSKVTKDIAFLTITTNQNDNGEIEVERLEPKYSKTILMATMGKENYQT